MKKHLIPSLVLAGALSPLLSIHVQAADYVLRASDGGSTSSFSSPLTGAAGGWATTIGGVAVGAPTAGNNYIVGNTNSTASGNWDLRTPNDALDYTFAGDSLTINASAGTALTRFIFAGTGARTLTINNLILNGGQLTSTASGTQTLAGNINLNGTAYFTGNAIKITAAMSGTGALTTQGSLTLAGVNSYTGGTIVNSGSLTVLGSTTLGATTGSLTVNAGIVNLSTTANTTVGSLSGSSGSIVNGGGGTTVFTVNQVTSGTFAGAIRGGATNFTLGSLSTAKLVLTGTGFNTGAYTVDAGTLIVGNGTSGAITGGGTTTVNAGTLGGSRASGNNFAGAVVIGNNVGTGDAVLTGAEIGTAGRIASAGSLTLNSDAKFVFDLVSTAGVVTGDQYIVNSGAGTTYINNGALFDFVFTGDIGAVTLGETFTAIEGGSFAGNAGVFSNLADGGLITSNGVTLKASYNDGDLILTVVPEPSSVALAIVGGIGSLLVLRRRQRA